MSLRHAINQMCKACIYDQGALGNWRQQVSACTSPKCPLFTHRPVSITDKRKRANRDVSLPKSARQLDTLVITQAI